MNAKKQLNGRVPGDKRDAISAACKAAGIKLDDVLLDAIGIYNGAKAKGTAILRRQMFQQKMTELGAEPEHWFGNQ